MKILYTTERGRRRGAGHGRTSDGRLGVELSIQKRSAARRTRQPNPRSFSPSGTPPASTPGAGGGSGSEAQASDSTIPPMWARSPGRGGGWQSPSTSTADLSRSTPRISCAERTRFALIEAMRATSTSRSA